MIKLTKKEKKSVIICIFIFIIVFIILEAYNANYYKIDMESFCEKGILNYKNFETYNSNVSFDFMKLVSDGEYDTAFQLIDKNNKEDMFNNDVELFKNDMYCFVNTYSELQYNTIFSKEFGEYIDEEIVCMILNSENEIAHSIRFNIRTYKNDKKPKVIILNIN